MQLLPNNSGVTLERIGEELVIIAHAVPSEAAVVNQPTRRSTRLTPS
jgi:hypothetical protein